MTTAPGELRLKKLDGLFWQPGKAVESLDRVYERAVAEGEEAIEWYLKKKLPKQRGAWWLRMSGDSHDRSRRAYPTVDSDVSRRRRSAPVSAGVGVGRGGPRCALDRSRPVPGMLSGWMRFLLTEMRIRRLLQGFQFDWAADKAAWKAAVPTDEQVQGLLARAKAFTIEVSTIVESETSAWTEEFKSSLNSSTRRPRPARAWGRSGGSTSWSPTARLSRTGGR